MEIVIKIVQFIAALSLLVLVHELGHFLFAKLFKCRVEKFYLFFNPWFTPLKFRIGETEYGIGWLPFGGYCKIAGMVDESMDTAALKEPPKPYEFRSKPAWQRFLVMIGGVLMNLVLAIVIYTGMSMRWGDSYYTTRDINATYGFSFSEFGHQIGFRDGDRILSIDGTLPESYNDLRMSLLFDGVQYVEVARGDSALRIAMHPQYLATIITEADFIAPCAPLVVDSLLAGGNAQAAGIAAGDRIMSVDGEAVSLYHNRIPDFAGRTVTLGIVREKAGVPQTIEKSVAVSAEGAIGIFLRTNLIPVSTRTYTLAEAIPQGFRRAYTEAGTYFKQIRLIFTPETGAYKQVGGLIAIGNAFPGTWDWRVFWALTAMISIMLAIVNLLPIPGLDGGHVLFVLYEMITRRKPSDRFMETATWIGLLFVLFLLVYSNGNDVVRLFDK